MLSNSANNRQEKPNQAGIDLNYMHSIDRAIELISRHSLELANKVESISPAHRNGLWRHEHMQDAKSKVPAFVSDLTPNESKLLELILVSHDLGRMIEQLNNFAGTPKSEMKNHGVYSCDELISLSVLDSLKGEDKELTLDAIRWHGERVVELEDGKSRQFCYFLRDLDKLEIFRQELNYTAKFGLGEIAAYLGRFTPEQRKELQSNISKYEGVFMTFFNKNGASMELPADFKDDPIANEVQRVMNSRLSQDSEAALALTEKRSATNSKCFDTFTEFLSYHLTFVFDLESRFIKDQIKSLNLLSLRFDYIKERSSVELFSAILNNVSERLK